MVETRSLKRSRRPSLGTDPCQEILTRLPVKSLLRFRCVSKTWRALINDRRFARAHAILAIKNRPESSRMYFLERVGAVTECVVRSTETLEPIASHGRLHTDTFKKQLPGQRSPTRAKGVGWRDVGAIDGLFMLVPRRPGQWPYQSHPRFIDKLMLWNPSIRRARLLPPPPKTPHDGANVVDIGLGFDPSIEDYKHVRFLLTGPSRMVVHSVLVYTLGTNSWKTNTFEGKGCPSGLWSHPYTQPKTVCFRGLMYILAMSEGVHPNASSPKVDVVSYDLSNEEFTSSNLPADIIRIDDYWDLRLANDGPSLALFYFHFTSGGSIWLARGFGADLTWSKRYTLAPAFRSGRVSSSFLYLNKNGEEMISLLGTHMVTSYNLKTGEEKVVEKKNAKWRGLRVCPYVESLMLLS